MVSVMRPDFGEIRQVSHRQTALAETLVDTCRHDVGATRSRRAARISVMAAAMLLACTLAGCGGSVSGGAAATAGPAAGALVSYRRQGGIAGLDDRLTVRPDGAYEISRRVGTPRTGRLAPADLARLRQALDGSHFADIPAVVPGSPIADGFTYDVGYGGHRVLAADGGIPAALAPVLGVLDDIMSG
jgi:hypothetical protein